jgi:nitronate monooxygenase
MTPRAAALCRLLEIRYPIVQSGMSRVAGAELVAEVSNAGGLGILAALRLQPDELRAEIRRIRALTGRPFGVNLWLHPAVVSPVSPSNVPEADVSSVQHKLDEFRDRLGLAHSAARPAAFPDLVNRNLDVILDERVPVWSIGLGNPAPEMVARCHERGVRVIAMVANVEDARAVADSGVDLIVAQGAEAGGHRSNWDGRRDAAGTMVLVPKIVDAVEQPVIAAGGIVDGRGLVAALALGASGVMLGTRFIAVRESIAPQFFKDGVLAAGTGDTTVSDAFTGLPMRVLRNRFAEDYSGAPVLPPMLQSNAAEDIFKAAGQRGDREHFPMPAGESAGLIDDMPGAADVVRAIVSEAEAVLRDLTALPDLPNQ